MTRQRDPWRAAYLILAALTLGVFPIEARAQGNHPQSAVRLVASFARAGDTAIVGTRFAAKLMPRPDKQRVVDYGSGASAGIGTAQTACARPDGHTLLKWAPIIEGSGQQQLQ